MPVALAVPGSSQFCDQMRQDAAFDLSALRDGAPYFRRIVWRASLRCLDCGSVEGCGCPAIERRETMIGLVEQGFYIAPVNSNPALRFRFGICRVTHR